MATPNGDGSAGARALGERQSRRRSPAERVVGALRRVAFWTAVFLPLVAGGVMLTGLHSVAQWRLFAALAATSVVALYLGHPHGEG
jgi:hypothetical protein